MVGICGAVTGGSNSIDGMVDGLTWTGQETTTTATKDELTICVATHSADPSPQPASTSERDAFVWLWGSVWGFDGPDGYETVKTAPTPYAAHLYDQHGIEFVGGLNGSFAGLIYDRDTRQAHIFTDRLGTRPLHYARSDTGLVFSTDIQTLPRHQAITPSFDLEYLAEYFTLQRSFGLKTPLEGVELFPPGSITTIDVDQGSVETRRYWEPQYDPEDRPRSYFVNRLAALVKEVVEDRSRIDATYGLLLSGGSDSRLALAALTAADRSVHAYHLNEWENREAEIARRTAETAGAEYTFLPRDRDYPARALDRTAPITNFVGYFNQVHAVGYADRLRTEVDALLTGHYGDMLFEGNHFPTETVDLGELGSFTLPVMDPVRTVGDVVAHRVGDRTAPAYIADALDRDIHEIYSANITSHDGRVVDHGVEYRSPREAVIASRCPLTNGTSHFFYQGTLQMQPSWTPFLDNRLVELFLSTPARYLLRGGLVGGAIERLAPELAAIPHAKTGVALSRPFAAQWLGTIAKGFADRHVKRPLPEPYWTRGPWPDHGELIRTHSFVRETFDEQSDLIQALPFLDADGIETCYQRHLEGEHNLAALYSLVTFLKMPVVRQVCAEEQELLQ